MEYVWLIRDHLYELSGLPNYPGAELTDLCCKLAAGSIMNLVYSTVDYAYFIPIRIQKNSELSEVPN